VIELRAGSATDVGLVRSNNQDELLIADRLFAVADGMGGPAAGEVAAHTAIEHLRDAFALGGDPTPDTLLAAAQAANRAVWDQAEANPEMRGMGTTLVALALVNDDHLAVINIGDSRLYVQHDGELRQVTSDHNLVAELVAEGRLSKEEAEFHPRRNVITRALGVDPEVPVDLFLLDAEVGDRFLLCSDGLFRELTDEYISALLRRLAEPNEAAHELVNEAKRRGGNDNITVVIVDVVDSVSEKDASPTTAIPLERPPDVEVGPESGRAPSARVITPRVVGFVLLLLVLLAGAVAGVAWYARAGYFVGLRGDRIIIFQGRPGGLLWFRPTIADATTVTTADVLAHNLPTLAAGQEEPSLTEARQYVHNLVAEQQSAQAAARPPAPTTTTTKPHTTTTKPHTTTTTKPKPRSTTPTTR
jgi:PPM family protein phosphatase